MSYIPSPEKMAALGYEEKHPRTRGCLDYRNETNTHAIWVIRDGVIKLWAGFYFAWTRDHLIAREVPPTEAAFMALLAQYNFPTTSTPTPGA